MLPTQARRAGLHRAIALLVAWAIAALAVTLRHQGGSLLDSMWAEDGTVYVQQALEHGSLSRLFEPYAGYLHVPARILAIVATAVPIDLAASVMSAGAVLAVAALAVYVYIATEGIIASRILRFVLAASMVLTPVARIESLDSLANLHFSLLVAAFWALLGRPGGRVGSIASSVVVGAAALSDPLSILLVPVAAYGWLRSPHGLQRAPAIVGAVCLVVQLIAIGSSLASSLGDRSPDLFAIVLGYPLRVVGGLLPGLRWSVDLWAQIGPALTSIGVVILTIIVIAIATSRREARTRAALALATSVLVFGAAMWLRWNPSLFPGDGDRFLLTGVRYLLAPILLLLGAVVLVLDGGDPRTESRLTAAATAVLVIVVSVTSAVDFTGPDRRTNAPSWSTELAVARSRCEAGSTTVEVSIAPRGWSMTMSCDVLDR